MHSASATANGTSYWTGGLVGYNYGLINGGSSASGNVQGLNGVGGLVGYNVGVINGSDTASAVVSGSYHVGGLVA